MKRSYYNPNSKWSQFLDLLNDDVYTRLCECRNTKADIKTLAKAHYQIYKDTHTPSDSIIAILEHLSCNSQLFDLTNEELKKLEKTLERI